MEAKVATVAQEQRLAPVASATGLAEDVKVVEWLSLVAVPERGLDLIGAPPLHRHLSDGFAAEALLDEDSPEKVSIPKFPNHFTSRRKRTLTDLMFFLSMGHVGTFAVHSMMQSAQKTCEQDEGSPSS